MSSSMSPTFKDQTWTFPSHSSERDNGAPTFSSPHTRQISNTSNSSHLKRTTFSSPSIGNSVSMRQSYSSEGAIRQINRTSSRSPPPPALPPLRSIISFESETSSEGSSRQRHYSSIDEGVSSNVTPTNNRSPNRRESGAESFDRMRVLQGGILESIFVSSTALARLAQDVQHYNKPLHMATEELEQMQQLTTKVDSYIRDLRYQVEVADSYHPIPNQQKKYEPEPPYTIVTNHQHRERPANVRSISYPAAVAHREGQESQSVWGATRATAMASRDMEQRRMEPFHTRHSNEQLHVRTANSAADPYRLPPYNQYQARETGQEHQEQMLLQRQQSMSSQRSPTSLLDDTSSTFTEHNNNNSRTSKYRKRSRAAAPESCLSCGAEDTPEWRRGPGGVRTLCNACGLHYSKMLRKKKVENEQMGSGVAQVTIEELRASVLVPEVANTS